MLFTLPFIYVLLFLVAFEVIGFSVTYKFAPEPRGKNLN